MFINVNWRDLLMRAFHTFWQGFAVVFVLPVDVTDLGLWKAALVAAVMAGLSAVKTFVLGYIATRNA